MKNTLLKSIAIIALALLMVTCTKEKQEITTITQPNTDVQLLRQVNWFADAANDLKDGKYLKTGEKMLIDSAICYIGNTLNYKYGFATETFHKLLFDTVYVNIPFLSAESKTYIVDALQSYNLTINQLRTKYQGISYAKKKLIACVVQNAGLSTNTSYVTLRVIAQFGVGEVQYPLSAEDEFWWQRNSYNCDATQVGEGAPNRFDNDINFMDRPAPQPGYRVWYTDLTIEIDAFVDPTAYRMPADNMDNFCDYKIFYATKAVSDLTYDVGCIGEDVNHPGVNEMLFYRDSLNAILTKWCVTNNRNFFSVQTQSINNNDNIWKHWPWLTHGIRHCIYDPSAQGPISILD